jgi:hypothetical protein
MRGSLEEYTPEAIGRIRADLSMILQLSPCDLDVLARDRSARRKREAAGVELVVTFLKTRDAAQTAAILVEKVTTGTMRTVAGFVIEGVERLAALPSLTPNLGLSALPSLLPSDALNSLPSLATPSQTHSSVPTLPPSSRSENTSLRPSLSASWKPMQPSTLPLSQSPLSSPPLQPSPVPRTAEPLAEFATVLPAIADQWSSDSPTLQSTQSVTGDFSAGSSASPESVHHPLPRDKLEPASTTRTPSSQTEYTSLQPSFSPTRQPTQASTLNPSRPLSTSPSLKPSRVSKTSEPLSTTPSPSDSPTLPPTIAEEWSSVQPSLQPTFEPSLIPSSPLDEILGLLSISPRTVADAAPLEPTASPTTHALMSPVALLTRPPTRLPSSDPTALPHTPAPMSPGDPPATAKPTFAPTPVPCPGRPPCTDHGRCDSVTGKCYCRAGWYASTVCTCTQLAHVGHARWRRQVP